MDKVNMLRRLTVAICLVFGVYATILSVVYYQIGERLETERDAAYATCGRP